MNAIHSHRGLSRRPSLPVLAMLIGVLGATTFATWLTWQYLERRAVDRFEAETLAITRQVETACADLLNALRGIRDALPRPLTHTNLPEPAGLLGGLMPAQSNAIAVISLGLKVDRVGLTNTLTLLSARTGSNVVLSPSPPARSLARDFGRDFSDLFIPVVRTVTHPTFFSHLCECSCWDLGSDLVRYHSMAGAVNFQVLQQVIGAGQVGFNAVLRLDPGDCVPAKPAGTNSEYLAVALLAVYSPAGTAAPANFEHRLPHTEGVLLAGISPDRLVRPVLESHRDDFGIRFRYGEREYAQLREWGEPIITGEVGRSSSRYSLERDVSFGGLIGRMAFTSTRAWEWSTGFWLAWLVAGAGLSSGGGLAVWMTSQIHAARLQEAETTELRAANAALAAVRETREQITRELHDNTLQNLYALGLELKRGKECLTVSSPEAAESLDRGLDEVRRISGDLRQFLTNDGGGRPVLGATEVVGSIVERFRRSSGAVIELTLDPETARHLSARTTAELAQIIREAISNALRHGAARRITVRLVPESPDGWRLEIHDDGGGFSPADRVGGSGLGLRHMERRAADLGAALKLDSSPGAGTCLRISWPATTGSAPVAATV